MTADFLLLAVGLAILTAGAETLVKAASDLARAAGVKPLVVGLTIVAVGTSAPELAVSLRAAWAGQGTIALGNVVGSNVINVLVILGASAMIAPLAVRKQLVRRDLPFLLAMTVLVILLALNNVITPLEGALLVALGVGYTAYMARTALKKSRARAAKAKEKRPPVPARTWALGLSFVLLGLIGLGVGGHLFLGGAVGLARSFGVSELVIGTTIVAAGTSLPELATSLVAALRGERDLAVGNIVGSNIFNLLIVLGAAALASSGGVPVPPGALTFDLPILLAVTVACIPVFLTDWAITRWEGVLFLSFYGGYAYYLVLHASGHDAEQLFGATLVYGIIPFASVLLFGTWVRGRYSPSPS